MKKILLMVMMVMLLVPATNVEAKSSKNEVKIQVQKKFKKSKKSKIKQGFQERKLKTSLEDGFVSIIGVYEEISNYIVSSDKLPLHTEELFKETDLSKFDNMIPASELIKD